MEIASVRHKNLRRFLETGKAAGLIAPGRIADMIAFIDTAEDISELAVPPNFGFHALKADRKGEFAMSVTRNWRLTFTQIDDRTIGDLNLEDYH